MFRQNIKLAVVTFAAIFAFAHPVAAQGPYSKKEIPEILTYAPFFKGSSWTYSGSDGTKEVVAVSEYKKFGNVNSVVCQSSLAGYFHLVFLSDRLYRFKNLSQSQDKLTYSNGIILLMTPLREGKVWRSAITGDSDAMMEVLGYESVTTAAGNFKNTLKVGLKYSDSPIFDGIIWLAEGVGIVQTLENHYLRSLESYSLGEYDDTVLNRMEPAKLTAVLSQESPAMPVEEGEKEVSFKEVLSLITKHLSPLNLFLASIFAILALFILFLSKISRSLKTNVNETGVESKKTLAATYMHTERYQKAQKILEKLISQEVRHADLYNSLGIAYMGQKKFSKASKAFRTAFEMNRDYTEAMINLAKSLFMEGAVDEARKVVESAIDEHPDYADLHNLYAGILENKNDIEGAIRHLNRAIEINPAYTQAIEVLKRLTGGGEQ